MNVLVLDALTNAITGVVYAFVGWRLRQRPRDTPATGSAWGAFTLWWYGLATTGFLAAAFSLAAASGDQDVALFATFQLALVVTFAISMGALVYYVFYLWTGKEWVRWPVAGLYVYYVLRFFYEISHARPMGIEIRGWRPILEYETPIMGPFLIESIFFLFLPQTAAALTYFMLYFSSDDAAVRTRILLVSMSILVLSAGAVVIARPPIEGAGWMQAAARAAVVAAAFGILRAYRDDDPHPATARAQLDAFHQRARDLV